MSSTAKSFLNKLKDINDANTVKVKVPSIDKSVEFKLASVGQQKALLRTAFEGVDGVITRSIAANNIIIDNAVSEEEFLIIDKPAIFIALRKESIGSKIKVEDKEYDLNDAKPINMEDIKLSQDIEHDEIKVSVKVPTLAADNEAAAKLAVEFAKFKSVDDKLKQSVDIVIAYESIKYIDRVAVGEDVIKFTDISVHERVELVNNLPLALNNMIINYIGGVKEIIDKSLTVAEEVVVEIDASFLSND